MEEIDENYFERDTKFDEIIEIFKTHKKIAILGTGKTYFAKRFSHEFGKNINSYVYWFQAFNFDIELKEFNQKLEQASVNNTYLNELISNEKILFIIDGCINNSRINDIISKIPFLVLLTTRDPNLDETFFKVDLGAFNNIKLHDLPLFNKKFQAIKNIKDNYYLVYDEVKKEKYY